MKNFPWRPVALSLWTLTLIFCWNTNFDTLTTVSGQMGANDVAAIMDGFRKTPHFWSAKNRLWRLWEF